MDNDQNRDFFSIKQSFSNVVCKENAVQGEVLT